MGEQRNHHNSALYKIPGKRCPEENLAKGWVVRIWFIQSRERETKMRVGFCFSADVAINVGISGFHFQRGKRRWREKAVKVRGTKADADTVCSDFSVFLRALMGSFINSTAMGWCSWVSPEVAFYIFNIISRG